MDLYFSPLACSMATRIALYEAGAEASYLEVDPKTKVVQNDGSDFSQVNPLGLVPTLRTDDGAGADRERRDPAICRRPLSASRPRRRPRHGAQPAAAMALLHRHRTAQGTVRAAARQEGAAGDEEPTSLGKNLSRLDYLENYLKGRDFLLDHFSVADAYLVTVINWTMATPPIELAKWPSRESLLRAPARAARHRQGDGGGVRALQGRTRPPQGGGVSGISPSR